MTIKRVIKLFNLYKPRNLEEVLEIGTILDSMGWEKRAGSVSLKFIGDGSYRKVYKFGDLPLVVKLPTGDGTLEENILHAENEMDAIKRVSRYKKYTSIRKYLPKVYYYNKTHGVTLMHEYPSCRSKKSILACVKASENITTVLNKPLDLFKNFSVSKNGKITLIDWGVLGSKSDWCQY